MKRVVLSILLMLAFCGYVAAVDLDAPAVKKVTIGSEIERGYSAINSRCSMRADILNYELCAFKVMNNEKHSNTDTDAFSLGFYYGEWVTINIYKETTASLSAEGPNDIAVAEAPKANRDADVYFKFYRKVQKELQVTDQQLCEAVHLRCAAVIPKMEAYRARLEKD